MRLFSQIIQRVINLIKRASLYAFFICLIYPIFVSAGENEHKIQVIFQPSLFFKYQALATNIEKTQQFQEIAERISKEFILPTNIKIVLKDCAEPIYQPADHTILMCYSVFDNLINIYQYAHPKSSKEDALLFAISINTFFLYHEMGHAFLDIYHLPSKSTSEGDADNLAILLALEYTNEGYIIVMDTAELFRVLGGNNKPVEADYWNEHLLYQQRFYNILCMSYAKYSQEVESSLNKIHDNNLLTMLKQKKNFCIYNYKRILNSWMIYLSPHMRKFMFILPAFPGFAGVGTNMCINEAYIYQTINN